MPSTTRCPATARSRCPTRSRATALHKYAAGHTDPHSALGVGALGGVLAAKAAMEKHGIPGTLKFFGEPAEKVCGSKPVHAAHGYYDDLDAAISFHPAYFRTYSNTTVWDTHCGSYWSKIYTFECPHPGELVGDGRAATAPIRTPRRARPAPSTPSA